MASLKSRRTWLAIAPLLLVAASLIALDRSPTADSFAAQV
jgi:hypothetical protein